VLIGFNQLNGQYIYGGDLAAGQLGNLAHWDLAPRQVGFLGPSGVGPPGGPLIYFVVGGHTVVTDGQ
jgi:hypothetical protein